ncbi:hypothetical protein [Rhodanobacter sp. MP1X3]|jgi:hypothetical protein|uniref:hypothetical protein n=1 Tax=Rhodanobacter sp. MP1X3 TaxID=2723086 RepID=UPI001611AFFC|nr:hypothetical protein [Rhodanobacter sp. MP1X3]MBB6241576.1 hypothetical protein [Rhodanobacter sp. MP1X3]
MKVGKPPFLYRFRRASFTALAKAGRIFAIFFRLLSAAILCAFAFAPGWVAFGILSQVVAKPSELDLSTIVVLAVCLALLYFLLMLAYRGFTGSGRKADGGLLPPWAMKVFVASFGVIAIFTVASGIYSGKWFPVLGGLTYLFTALSVYGALKKRQMRGKLVA